MTKPLPHIVSIILCYLSTAATARAQNVPDIKVILAAIAKQETAVRTMTLKSHYKCEMLDDKNQNLAFAGEGQMLGVFDSMPGGRERLEVTDLRTPYANAATSFSIASYIATYNGKIGEVYNTRERNPGDPSAISEGILSGNRPSELINCFGREASVFGFTEAAPFFDPDKFSCIVTQPGVKVELKPVLEANQKYLQLTRIADVRDGAKSNAGKHEFLLDPARNFSIVQIRSFAAVKMESGSYEYATSNDVSEETRVLEFTEPLPGVFYPMHSQYTRYFTPKAGPKVVFFKSDTEILSANFNDPKVDDASFQIAFPKGAHVADTANNREFIISGTPEEQAKMLDDAVHSIEEKIKSAETKP